MDKYLKELLQQAYKPKKISVGDAQKEVVAIIENNLRLLDTQLEIADNLESGDLIFIDTTQVPDTFRDLDLQYGDEHSVGTIGIFENLGHEYKGQIEMIMSDIINGLNYIEIHFAPGKYTSFDDFIYGKNAELVFNRKTKDTRFKFTNPDAISSDSVENPRGMIHGYSKVSVAKKVGETYDFTEIDKYLASYGVNAAAFMELLEKKPGVYKGVEFSGRPMTVI